MRKQNLWIKWLRDWISGTLNLRRKNWSQIRHGRAYAHRKYCLTCLTLFSINRTSYLVVLHDTDWSPSWIWHFCCNNSVVYLIFSKKKMFTSNVWCVILKATTLNFLTLWGIKKIVLEKITLFVRDGGYHAKI